MAKETRRVVVVHNTSSGLYRQGVPEEQIRAVLRAAGVDPEIVPLHKTANIREAIRGFDIAVAAGGDGTVSTVASAVFGTETILGVLPTGTLNHFAKDLHVPMDLNAAAHVIANGRTTQADAAEVNGRIFVNNSSIGLYPALVTERERLIKRGVPKRIAMLRAATVALWRFPERAVRVTTQETGRMARTPLVFVGNNRYHFSGLQAGSRNGLRDGLLQVCTVENPGRLGLIRAGVLAFLGKLRAVPQVHSMDTAWTRIDTRRKHVKVAVDGEVVRMRSPLNYSIHAGALKVLVPGG